MTIGSCTYFEKELGAKVVITVRSNSRTMRARLVGTEYRISVPPGTQEKDYVDFIRQIKAKLGPAAEKAAERRFEPGMVLDGFHMRVEVHPDASRPNHIRIVPSTEPDGSMLLKVLVDPAANPAAYQAYVNRRILRNACIVAGKFLRPEVLEAAARVGVADRVKGVSFNTNRSNYGLCYRDGRIELSSRLVFYPAELRELVTMHELAHLTHHDHSAAFHALLDRYLGGRERELEKALRAFRSPLF